LSEGTIQIAFVSEDAESSTLRSLENQLNRELDIDVEVVSYTTMGEALFAVCDGSKPTLAWVDAFTYIAAENHCGALPHLGVELSALDTRRSNFEIIYSGSILPVPQAFNDLTDKIWCRVDETDTISWIYPAITMQSEGFNPIIGLGGVMDVEDYPALVLAVYDGTCDVGAIPEGTLRNTARQLERENRQDDEATEELIIDLAGDNPDIAIWLDGEESWEPVPHEVFISPDELVLPKTIQESVVEAMLEIASDDDSPLTDLLTYQTIDEKGVRDFRDFRRWLTAANWSMGQ
jgi:hypothetical protein